MLRYRIPTVVPYTPQLAEATQVFLQHARRLRLIFVTVAAPYKPVRLAHTLLEVPASYEIQAERLLRIASGTAEHAPIAERVMRRPEWTHTTLLWPTAADAPALDGWTIAGFASAQLIISCAVGHCAALLWSSDHDSEARASLHADAWQVVEHPSAWQRFRMCLAQPVWTGTPSLVPVPQILDRPDPVDATTGPTTRLDPAAPSDIDLARWLRGDVLAAPSLLAAPVDEPTEPAGFAMERSTDEEAPDEQRITRHTNSVAQTDQ